MNKEQAAQVWAQKIDSKEKYDAAVRDAYGFIGSLRRPISSAVPSTTDSPVASQSIDNIWPNRREQYREMCGVYPPATSVLEEIRGYAYISQYWPHISKDDPTMIAYTPDKACAHADRQIRTTIGKFLRKVAILMSDKEIAKIEHRHKSELDPTFKTTTTQDGIERVYTTMVGDTACMRYTRDRFGFNDYHPSAVYADVPGLALAYLEDEEGRPVARSLIYDNPANPADKRYVRLYGAPQLKAKLERSGYRLAGLRGVPLRKLRDPSIQDPHWYVMPYLDNPGGPSSGCNDEAAQYVAHVETEDTWRVLNNDERARYIRAGATVSPATSTSAYVICRPSHIETTTCPLSGRTINSLNGDQTDRYLASKDGPPVEVHADAVRDEDQYTRMIWRDTGTGKNIWVCVAVANADEWRFKNLPGRENTIDTPAMRECFGLVELDQVLYPDTQLTHASYAVTTEDGKVIRKQDAIAVLPNGSTFINWRHISALDGMRASREYVKLADHDDRPLFTRKDNPSLVKTASGRKAVIGFHDVRQCSFTDEWMYSRSTTLVGTLYGFHVIKAKTAGLTASSRVSDRFIGHVMESALYGDHTSSRRVESVTTNRWFGLTSMVMDDGAVTPRCRRYGETVRADKVMRAAHWIVDNKDNRELLNTTHGYYTDNIKYIIGADAMIRVVAKMIEALPETREMFYPVQTADQTNDERFVEAA